VLELIIPFDLFLFFPKLPLRMRKILLILLVWLITSAFASGFPAIEELPEEQSVWLAAAEGLEPAAPVIKINRVNSNSVEITVLFSGIWASRQITKNGTYTELALDGYGFGTAYGLPDLPEFTLLSEIPGGAEANIQAIQYEFTAVRLAEFNLPDTIRPLQAPDPKSGESGEWIPADNLVYQTDQTFPEAIVRLVASFQQRDHTMLPIQVSPVLYNPVKGEIQILRSILIRLDWKTGQTAAEVNSNRLQNASFDQIFSDTIDLSLASAQESIQTLPHAERYLIISPDVFLSSLQPFVSLKQSQGFQVTLVGLSTIGSSTTTGIKKYIQNAYNTWENPPVYLLLVGDSNFIPAWPFTADYPLTNDKKTDLYYATMDGEADYVPDIFYGRLPARDLAQLTAMLDKITAYAQNTGAESWVKKASFVATCDSAHYATPIGTHSYVIQTHTAPLGFSGIFPSNPQAGGDQLFCRTEAGTDLNISNHIISSVNDQRSLLTYSGHGSKSSWSDGMININQNTVRSFVSNQISPFVASFACLTGDFANDNADSVESFGETWMIQPAKGAIAFLGSADDTYWEPDDRLERVMYDRLFSNPANPPAIDQALFAGLQAVQNLYVGFGHYYWETYNLLGDPSTQIWISPRTADYAISLPEQEALLCAGSDSTLPVTINSTNGFANSVDLTLSGLPEEVSAQFSPASLIPPAASNLTLAAASNTPAATYDMAVVGQSGSLQRNLSFQLRIDHLPPDTVQLLSPAHLSTGQSLKPTFSWLPAAQAARYQIQIALDPDFLHIIFQADNLNTPTYTPTVSLESLTSYYWRVKAGNGCGTSAYSAAAKFDTQQDVGDCEHVSDSVILYHTDFEEETSAWQSAGWLINTARFLSPAQAFFAAPLAVVSDQKLTGPEVSIPEDSTGTSLRFWQWRNLEASTINCLDGGILEYSINHGAAWSAIPNSLILSDAYDLPISSAYGNPLAGKMAWCQMMDWQKVVVDISSLAGQEASFRLRFGSDNSTASEGWYVDDVQVRACLPSYSFSVFSPATEKNQFPGLSVTYPVQILNSGRPDSYQVSVSGNAWVVVVEGAPGGLIDYNEIATVTIRVYVPAGAARGDNDQAIVSISSLADPEQTSQVTLTTSVTDIFRVFLPLLLK
jgi:hypothetical protein